MIRRTGYRQIAEELRAKINSGELAAGAQLPSESALSQSYDVTRLTAARAVGVLRTEGLVETDLGRGVVVRHRHDRTRVRLRRKSTVITRSATPGECERLDLQPGAYVAEVRWQATVDVYAADEVEFFNT